MNLSGGSAWENLQSYLSSTVEAEYRGEKLNLSAVRNLAYDPDPAVRKDAYDAEIACYDKIKDAISFSLNSLKLQVTTECELRKAGSPLEMTLRHSRMQKTTLDAMITAIEEYLPVFWKYLRAKAKMLGADEVALRIGHAVGGVCPFAINGDVRTFLDVSLKRFDTVFPACGSANSAIELSCDGLQAAAQNFAGWVDVCKGWQDAILS